METILAVFIGYFLVSYLYTLFMTVSSFFYNDTIADERNGKHTYAIIIPAYKEDHVIQETVLSAVRQQYDATLFKVFVMADQLQKQTITTLKDMGAELIEVEFVKSTKVKSLKVFAEIYGLQSDYTVLLDADNCIEPSFLSELNNKINSSKADVIQLERKSKNHGTGISFLDAFSEFANNAILCKGPNTHGLSSKLSGSGMILKSYIFTQLIKSMNGISGFDKEMELLLTKSLVHISYFETPYVLDEKIENASQIKTQRSRWIYAQFDYLRKFFKSGLEALLKGQLDHAHKVFQLALPPRVLGFMVLCVLNIFTLLFTSNKSLIYTILLADFLFLISYVILFIQFIRHHKIPNGLLKDLFKMFVGYLLTIKYFKRAGKEFLHTKHQV
jgi:cellulose synthase/poly-beta-1,6-N-acetylglucosamine synthase-like glycosyltransferase